MWSFLWSFIQIRVLFVGIRLFPNLVCRELKWISWTRNHVFHHGPAFSSLIFFSVVLSKSTCVSAFGPSSSPSSSLVILFIHSAFSLCFFFFGCHISVQNCSIYFASGCWYLFVPSPPNCWLHFLSLFWNVLFCLYCFTLCRYLFNHPFFRQYFLVYFLKLYCYFYSVAFSFLFPHIPASFICFLILACFCRFFICFSSRNFHPGFDFSFELFEGIPIFSQTDFALA